MARVAAPRPCPKRAAPRQGELEHRLIPLFLSVSCRSHFRPATGTPSEKCHPLHPSRRNGCSETWTGAFLRSRITVHGAFIARAPGRSGRRESEPAFSAWESLARLRTANDNGRQGTIRERRVRWRTRTNEGGRWRTRDKRAMDPTPPGGFTPPVSAAQSEPAPRPRGLSGPLRRTAVLHQCPALLDGPEHDVLRLSCQLGIAEVMGRLDEMVGDLGSFDAG